MLKKTIKFTNFNDEVVEETFYFHLSKAEIIEMELTAKGGLKVYLERIMSTRDGGEIYSFLKKITLGSYGKRSDDGARFIKTPESRAEFESSEAFSELMMQICTDADAAAEFVNGIVPKGLAEEAAKLASSDSADRPQNRQERRHPSDTAAKMPPPSIENERPPARGDATAEAVQEGPILLSRQQLVEMDDAELRSGLASGKYKLQ